MPYRPYIQGITIFGVKHLARKDLAPSVINNVLALRYEPSIVRIITSPK
jgi:hypothetical protein